MDVVSLPLEANKPALRRHFLERRKQQTDIGACNARLNSHLKRLLNDLRAEAPNVEIALYQALSDEASVRPGPEQDYFYPRVVGEQIEFRRPHSQRAFRKGSFQILEPEVEHSEELPSHAPLAVCCPGLAVDLQGTRLGWGRGYYDRFFIRHPEALRIGVAYQIQISKDQLPADSWDQPLDWIVTEEMILRTSNRSPDLWKSLRS